jgi:hypothetical protein
VNDTASPASLGRTLNNAGRLVQVMNRLALSERRDAVDGETIWVHGLKANGSIVSETFRLTVGGGLIRTAG